ncbi:DUF3124 domain-containing protein [Fulvivirga lutea]|uniref:DUF3124 domain-containing protein n=1 Tax=Fulvivirga lutea TaxID=2810512 RepID=A0A974WF96_9BACT|nr:DUF3124 domain-containing protein [Fulvivirga lutea]QSE97394.1 DUF3124 domain-containing protein [Fulvivirga lutea]
MYKWKVILIAGFIANIFFSCEREKKISSINPVVWSNRFADMSNKDSLEMGTTYLSVYSQIYSRSEDVILDLTATVSIRNTNRNDTIFIDHAEYFNSAGESLRNYFDKTIYVAPMETVEIVIDQYDKSGGTGANFIFDWKIKPGSNKPLFEGVMISASGNLGLSFTTTGQHIRR